MTTLDETALGYPLPHPDNPARTVDVPRLRAALSMIDEHVEALQLSGNALAADKADKAQVAIDIAAAVSQAISDLLDGAPEAYDTLVEIAAKLTDNDDVVAGILSTLATKAAASDVATALGLKADAAAMTDALATKADADAMAIALADKTSPEDVAVVVQAASVPVGAIVAAVGPLGTGWLPCDGAVYLKAVYPDLAERVGDIADKILVAAPTVNNGASGYAPNIFRKLEGRWFGLTDADIYMSLDGFAWSAIYSPGASAKHRDVAFGNGRYLATASGVVFYSTTLVGEWSVLSYDDLYSMIFTKGRFIAGNSNGGVSTSTGTASWENYSFDMGEKINVIIEKQGRVITGASGGKVRFSDDLVTWTAVTTPFTVGVMSLFDDGDRILAGLSNGQIWQSLNLGETWTQVGSAGASAVTQIGKLESVYLVGLSSGIFFSRDLTVFKGVTGISSGRVLGVDREAKFILFHGSGGQFRKLSPFGYDVDTEFVVPKISDTLTDSSAETITKPRWIRALAA